jgi:hypothetical protein
MKIEVRLDEKPGWFSRISGERMKRNFFSRTTGSVFLRLRDY